MTDWMCCNTCKNTVIVNETGICLACQKGFTGTIESDNFLATEKNDYYEEIEWEKIFAEVTNKLKKMKKEEK